MAALADRFSAAPRGIRLRGKRRLVHRGRAAERHHPAAAELDLLVGDLRRQHHLTSDAQA